MPASERKRHESGSGSQPPRFAGLAVWYIWIACNRSSERITGYAEAILTSELGDWIVSHLTILDSGLRKELRAPPQL